MSNEQNAAYRGPSAELSGGALLGQLPSWIPNSISNHVK